MSALTGEKLDEPVVDSCARKCQPSEVQDSTNNNTHITSADSGVNSQADDSVQKHQLIEDLTDPAWQQPSGSENLKNTKSSLQLPEHFKIGKVASGADCFFDSVAEGLGQIRADGEFDAKSLRKSCHKYALENEWVKTAVINGARLKSCISDSIKDNDIWDAYLVGIHFTTADIEEMRNSSEQEKKDLYRTLSKADCGGTLVAPIWGRYEIEGRIICKEYSVKLHVIEKKNANGDGAWTEKIVNVLGSMSVDSVDYSDGNTIHLVNKGNLHFEPVLSTQNVQHAKEQFYDSSDYEDSDDSQGQIQLNEDLINTVRGSDSEEEKLKMIDLFLSRGADVNFQDANRENNTPLHSAVRRRKSKIVKFLIGKGANSNRKNNKSKTPLDIAKRLKKPDIIQVLEPQPGRRVEVRRVPSHVEKNQRITFNRKKGSAAAEGQFYEIKLATLFLLKGVSKKIDRFYLASNMDDADKFDDIVFKYSSNGVSKVIFLQAKHKEKVEDPDKNVTVKKLLSGSDDDFSLQKYFTSCLKIKQLYLKSNKSDPVFEGKFDDCEFIIYTNARPGFSTGKGGIKKLEKGFEEVSVCKDSVLNISEEKVLKCGSYYQLVYDEKRNDKITNVLQYSPDSKNLAKELAESIFPPDSKKEKREGINIMKPIFKNYRIPLAEKVLEKSLEDGKFRRSFLDGDKSLSVEDMKFRNIFFKEAERITGKTEIDIKSELSSKTIKLSQKFWNTDNADGSENCELSLPSDSVGTDDINQFLGKLKLFLNQPDEEKLGEIIKRNIQKIYGVERQDIDPIFAEVEYRVRMWWQKENYYLTKKDRFLQDAVRVSVRFNIKEPVVLFTGRTKQLDKLHETLQYGRKVVISQMASVTGLGGVGKSELARKYISAHRNYYDDNFIWIDATNYLTIEESFRSLAKDKLRMNTKDTDGKEKVIESIVLEVYNFFAERKRKSLFIFDNAGKYKTLSERDEGIDKFLPDFPDNKPFILITSRYQEWDDIKSLPLGVFTVEEAVEYIRKSLELGSQESEMKELAYTLQYLPLALRQAVAYIKMENKQSKSWSEKTFTINDYLRQYRERSKDLLKHLQEENESEKLDQHYGCYTETVLTTWIVTIDKIKQKVCGKKALRILNIIAYLAPDEIPVREIFLRLLENEEMLHNSVELLDQYSMANLKHGKLNVHRLVQQVTRIKLEEENKEKDTARKTLELLGESFDYDSDEPEADVQKRQLVPHLEALLSHIDYYIEKNPLQEKTIEENYVEPLLVWMSYAYGNMGNARRKTELLERALPILKRRYGHDHPNVATLLTNLGNSYGALGDPQKQKELVEDSLHLFVRHYGHDSFVVGKTLVNLSNAYAAFGDVHKRKELLERALQILERYDREHFVVAKALRSLGDTYGDLGDSRKKKELVERALPILENHFGHEHFEVAMALQSLGTVYGDFGNPEKQKELYERALAIEERHYGLEHFQVAKTLENLGNTYGVLGDRHKQKDLLEQSLFIFERHYGPKHFQVAATLVNLGATYGTLGEHRKEKELLERALPILEKHYGHAYYEVAQTLVNLANCYGVFGDHRKQKDLLEDALPTLSAHYGRGHYRVARILVDLANAYESLGDPQKQKELLETALPVLERHYVHDYFEVAKTVVNLSNAYGHLGDIQKQKELLERALPILKNHYGSDHFEIAKVLINLGKVYGHLEDFQKEIELHEQALAIEQSYYGADHFEVARTLASLSNAYGELRNYQKQKELLEKAIPILEGHYGPDYPYVVKGRNILNMLSAHAEILDTFGREQSLEPQFLAAENGDLSSLKQLLENGLDVNICDDLGHRTSLHFASGSGHLHVVDFLLQNKANTEATDINGSTPLHYAAHGNHEPVVIALLEGGANLNAVDNYKMNPVDYTTSGSVKAVMKSTNELFTAVTKNCLQKAKKLVQNGGIINSVDNCNKLTLLHYAAHNGNTETVEFLLNMGANVKVRDKDFWTPLHYASQGGRKDIARALLSKGANVNDRNNQKQTSLDIAKKCGNLDVTDILRSSTPQEQIF